MIDRYLIRYFLAVVEQGNFSRAAAQCNVAQPTLSVGIAKLEKAVGHRLFARSNQRVEMTEAGARFLTHARRIEREFNNALAMLDDINPAREKRVLRLGILHSISGAVIARAAHDSRAHNPGPVEFAFASERELIGRLTRGRLDAIVTVMRPTIRDFAATQIMEEGYAMVFAADHALAERKLVHAEELGSEPMIVRRHCEILPQISRHFLERGIRPRFSLRTTNDERAQDMVRSGMGITVMPDSYRAPGIRHIPLADFTLRRTLGFYLVDGADAHHLLLKSIAATLRQTASRLTDA